MGGCTLTVIRDTREEAVEYIKTQILRAAEGGLWPDSVLVVLKEGAEKADLYKVHLEYEDVDVLRRNFIVKLEQAETGPFFHVGVAARFNRPLKPGEWVATVHVHS